MDIDLLAKTNRMVRALRVHPDKLCRIKVPGEYPVKTRR